MSEREQAATAKAALTSIGRVLALRFQAGAIVLFIRWRDGAERRTGFWPLDSFLGNWPWPPS